MRTERGCFVYRVLSFDGIRPNYQGMVVRSGPTTKKDAYRTDLLAVPHNLVSIDEIRTDKDDNKFLRLSDGSGWLFERKKDEEGNLLEMMEKVAVESGLWTFYVDNYNTGIRLRNHPIDEKSTKTSLQTTYLPKTTLPPMQKIYCDRKVVFDAFHGTSTAICTNAGEVTFYRLQGTNAWVFDKRINSETGTESFMLLPEYWVKTGLFAFQNISSHSIGTRYYPNVGDDCRIPSDGVNEGEVIACDAVRPSPYPKSTNGPFLRLTNGMGWLFEYKYGEKLMEEVPIEDGIWSFEIVNEAGMALRRQPIDKSLSHNKIKDKVYTQGTLIRCDRRIVSSGITTFYRVQGTQGWVFDRRKHSDSSVYDMMVPRASFSVQPTMKAGITTTTTTGWTPDFVRGIASTVAGQLAEIAFNEQSRMISFSKETNESSLSSSTRINVYYTTRTVGTVLFMNTNTNSAEAENSNNNNNNNNKRRLVETTQLFRRNCTNVELAEIFKDPRTHMNRRYNEIKNNSNDWTRENDSVEVNVEEEMRSSLIRCEQSIEELRLRRNQLVESILEHDNRRLQKSAQSMRQADRLSKAIADQIAAEELRVRQAKAAADRTAAEELRGRTCRYSYCSKVFGSPSARQNHENAVHVSECPVCFKELAHSQALYQHQRDTGHW